MAKVIRRFLVDQHGPVESILMRCLKPKAGAGTLLEDTPSHLPPDESYFALKDIVAGPLEVIRKGSKHFQVPLYQELQIQFNILSKSDLILHSS